MSLEHLVINTLEELEVICKIQEQCANYLYERILTPLFT